MQATVTFRREELTRLVQFIFEVGAATVFEAYSAYEEDVRCFGTAAEHLADIDMKISEGDSFLLYVLHYPETKGYVEKQKITLDAKKCHGHKWRFCINGWGLIQFQIDLRQPPAIHCGVAVNSQVRAEAWGSQY